MLFSQTSFGGICTRDEEAGLSRRSVTNRERNRVHARETRQRKKAKWEALRSQVKELQLEGKALKQMLQECHSALILVEMMMSPSKSPSPSLLLATTTELVEKLCQGNKKDDTFLSELLMDRNPAAAVDHHYHHSYSKCLA